MKANCIPTEQTTEDVREIVLSTSDTLDVAAVVALVEADFVPSDSTTWPAASTNFPLLTASAVWEIEHDAVSDKDFFVAPEPAGGWDFVSTAAGPNIVGFIVRGTASTDRVFANKFATPIPVPAAGVHITLPYVAAQADQIIAPAEEPYVLE